MLLGSSTTASTLSEPEPVECSPERPLCRTSQLIVCLGLAMTRMIIYRSKLRALSEGREASIQKLQMNEFEEWLEESVADPCRLVSETLQLENFIFSTQTPEVKATVPQQEDTLPDWVLRLGAHE